MTNISAQVAAFAAQWLAEQGYRHRADYRGPSRTTGDKAMNDRVQIPTYTDRWMMGDRYGEIIKITKQRRNFPPRAAAAVSADAKGTYIEMAHVKLDKSGKTMRFVLADCTFS